MSSMKPDPHTAANDPPNQPSPYGNSEPVSGRYEIIGRLGQGPFGTVFRSHDSLMQRQVALKVIRQNISGSRFLAEGRAAAKLQHANIASVYEVGEWRGTPYLAMEMVEGKDLEAIVRERGRLPLKDALNVASQAAQALSYAHERGIIHRNITPGSLLIDAASRVKIIDFAFAAHPEPERRLTMPMDGEPTGTVAYLAPEQAIDSGRLGPAADVYSLGCTLFYAATGKQLAPDRTMVETLMWHQKEQAPKLSSIVPEAPLALDSLLQRMLAKRPDERPAMPEVAQRLDSIRAELSGGGKDRAVTAATGVLAETGVLDRSVGEQREEIDKLPSMHPSEIRSEGSLPAASPSADISIGMSLAVSILCALFLSLSIQDITAFWVLAGAMTGIHAASWLFVEGFRSSRSAGFKIAAFTAGFLLLWEVMQLLLTAMH